jgi:hypothetical protein
VCGGYKFGPITHIYKVESGVDFSCGEKINGRLLMHHHGLALIYIFLHFSNLIYADELEFG